MGLHECFSKLLGLCVLFQAVHAHGAPLKIERKGDEILLPPYLTQYEGGILNVTSKKTTDQNNRRSAKAGEWLDYGDSISAPDRLAFYVQMNEGLQWVGGGVFEGQIAGGLWTTDQPAYEVVLNRGWMKVWAKPTSFSGNLKIRTPKAVLNVTDGIFWVYASPTKTEVYVLSGSVKSGEFVNEANLFYDYSAGAGEAPKLSSKWDFVSLEERIKKLYPKLVELSHVANEDWLKDTAASRFAKLREKGWIRADRYFPTPTPSPTK